MRVIVVESEPLSMSHLIIVQFLKLFLCSVQFFIPQWTLLFVHIPVSVDNSSQGRHRPFFYLPLREIILDFSLDCFLIPKLNVKKKCRPVFYL